MQIINYVIAGVFILCGVIGLLMGRKRGLVGSAIKAVGVVISAIVALSLTPVLLEKAYQIAQPLIQDLLEKFNEVLQASPTLAEYLPMLLEKLIAPIVFLVVFVVCAIVMAIVTTIVNIIIKGLLNIKKITLSRIVGMGIGALTGIFVALCIVFPVTGYFAVLPPVYENVKQTGIVAEETLPQNVEQIITQGKDLSLVQTTNKLTNKAFMQLVSYNDGESNVSAFDDVNTVISLIPPIKQFANELNDIETMSVEPLHTLADNISANKKLRTIIAEIISKASQTWLEGNTFMEINLKEQLGDYRDALDSVLENLAVSNEQNIGANLHEFADTLYSVKTLYIYVSKINTGLHVDEMADLLHDVFENMTPTVAQVMSDALTVNVIQQMGISENSAETVSEIMNGVINGVVDLATHQTETEATAVNALLHYVVDEDGGKGVTAEEVIQNITDSHIMEDILTEVAEEQTIEIEQTQREQLAIAIDNYRTGEDYDVENEALLGAIEALFGIPQ